MALQMQGNSGAVAEVLGTVFRALNTRDKPLEYNVGHYRVNHRCALIATQAANSRLFELRNTHATNFIVITRLLLRWMQTAAHTAAIEDSLDVFKCTSFSAVDTTNTVTPTASAKKTSMSAAPGNAAIRGVTVAGAAAGMTGGTLTKDGGSIGQLAKWLLLAQPTAGLVDPTTLDVFDDVNGTHPLVLVQNEGIEIENRVLLGAAAGSTLYVDCSWAEVAVY